MRPKKTVYFAICWYFFLFLVWVVEMAKTYKSLFFYLAEASEYLNQAILRGFLLILKY